MVLPRIEKTLELQLFLDSSLSKYKKNGKKLHCFFLSNTVYSNRQRYNYFGTFCCTSSALYTFPSTASTRAQSRRP